MTRRVASAAVALSPLLTLAVPACGDSDGSTYLPAGGQGGAAMDGGAAGLVQGGSAGKGNGAGGDAGGKAGGAGSAGASGSGQSGSAGASGNGGGGSGNAGTAGTAGGGSGGSGTLASCRALREAEQSLPSGEYLISPANVATPFTVYCDMETNGGGWTLALNEGTIFDAMGMGVTDASCYLTSCTNRAYSTVPIVTDVMLDLHDSAISGATYTARAIVNAVHSGTRGVTLRTAFTAGPFHFEAEDNSNVIMDPPTACNTMPFADMHDMLCGPRTITLGDATGSQCQDVAVFAIGGSESYLVPWDNCAGWPQYPNPQANYYPDNVRVWIR